MQPFHAYGYWHIQDRLFCLELSGNTQLGELPTIFEVFLEQTRDIEPPIHLVLDVSELSVTSNTWSEIFKIRHTLHYLPITQVCIVCHPNQRMLRILLFGMFDLARIEARFFTSFAEALEQCR